MILSSQAGRDHPSNVLRQMAEKVGGEEAGHLEALAVALEQHYGRQNNAFQVALGLTDLDLRDAFAEEIMRVQVDLSRRMDAADERQQKMMEFLEELQGQVRALHGGTPS